MGTFITNLELPSIPDTTLSEKNWLKTTSRTGAQDCVPSYNPNNQLKVYLWPQIQTFRPPTTIRPLLAALQLHWEDVLWPVGLILTGVYVCSTSRYQPKGTFEGFSVYKQVQHFTASISIPLAYTPSHTIPPSPSLLSLSLSLSLPIPLYPSCSSFTHTHTCTHTHNITTEAVHVPVHQSGVRVWCYKSLSSQLAIIVPACLSLQAAIVTHKILLSYKETLYFQIE